MIDDLEFAINAWTGAEEAPRDKPGSGALKWALGEAGRRKSKFLAPEAEPDQNEWWDERVGWGLVVPFRNDLSADDLAAGKDLEHDHDLQTLLAMRMEKQGDVPVFHYGAQEGPGMDSLFIRNFKTDRPLEMSRALGLGDERIPYYLLIYASPSDIPWSVQYQLQVRHAVGRLDPGIDGIGNYFKACANDWVDAAANFGRTATWAVDHGEQGGKRDITSLMREAVAVKLHDEFDGDSDIDAHFLDGKSVPEDATGAALINELESNNPGLVVTSSHGMAPPGSASFLRENLGLPLDQQMTKLNLGALLQDWKPDGCIWMAQACCSAGSDNPSVYDGLFNPGSEIGGVLSGVAAAGAGIAPLPARLLGSAKPARAFFGQVEPTFNYTLEDPILGQILTDDYVAAFYQRLFLRRRVGRILEQRYDRASEKFRTWRELENQFNAGKNVEELLLATRITAIDIDSLVLLGDPAAVIPSNG